MSAPPSRVRGFGALARNADGAAYLERFLVAAVAALLLIRFSLELTGYPRIGGRGLHIAHLLWGGLLMVIAIGLLLAFLGRRVQRAAAVVAGIGFGAFIDELGKFITSDNNYLFRPAIALIYVVFILLFLAGRAIVRDPVMSPAEYLANAVLLLEDGTLRGLDAAERERALTYLRCAESHNRHLADALTAAIRHVPLLPEERPGLPARLGRALRARYPALVGRPWFAPALTALFVLLALYMVALAVVLIVADADFSPRRPGISFAEAGHQLSALAAGGCALIGVLSLARSRPAAYEWFRRAMLVSIFLGQVFAFYEQQLAAIVGLAVSLLLLVTLDQLIDLERRDSAGAAAGVPQPA
jgi:hypothetical protein